MEKTVNHNNYSYQESGELKIKQKVCDIKHTKDFKTIVVACWSGALRFFSYNQKNEKYKELTKLKSNFNTSPITSLRIFKMNGDDTELVLAQDQKHTQILDIETGATVVQFDSRQFFKPVLSKD